MTAFISRRLLAAFFVVFVTSFIVYVMMANAGNPLAFLNEIQDDNRRAAVEASIRRNLSLDKPVVQRFWDWLVRLVRPSTPLAERFGRAVSQEQVSVWEELKSRVPMTLKLVSASTIMSIVVGISVGVVTAIRQYSGFDYLVSFFTFVFFSLPVFWVAIILKDLGGINLNDWLRDSAQFSTFAFVLFGLVAAVIIYSSAGGAPLRKLAITAAGVAAFEGILIYISVTRWLRNPGFGPVVLTLIAIAIACGVTAVMAGWRNTRARNSALTTAAIGAVLWWPLQVWLDNVNLWKIVGLGVVAVAVGVAVGYAYGGFDKGLSARTAGVTAFLVAIVIFVDRAMQAWDEYSSNSVIRNRPIRTLYDREGRLQGDFWVKTDNIFSHLVLPTLALMLISVATYTRYSRGSMLEVLNQDYIRTARSKGLTERTVVIRHGLRNALIPLATIVAFDIGGVLGGAVITERVFQWDAMGTMFITGLQGLDPNSVMAFFLVIATLAVVFNLIADLVYAVLDPRIRLVDAA
jgi:peptide/nickel transport system permease protein